jgi:hypothetical protein
MFLRNLSGTFFRASFSARRLPMSVIASALRPTFSFMRRPSCAMYLIHQIPLLGFRSKTPISFLGIG